MPPAGTELKGCSHPLADCDLQDRVDRARDERSASLPFAPLALTFPTAHPFCSVRCPRQGTPYICAGTTCDFAPTIGHSRQP
jgi:hypothetical protein